MEAINKALVCWAFIILSVQATPTIRGSNHVLAPKFKRQISTPTVGKVCNSNSGFTCAKDYGTCTPGKFSHTCKCKPDFQGFPCDLGPMLKFESMNDKDKEIVSLAAVLSNVVYKKDTTVAFTTCPLLKDKLKDASIDTMKDVNFFMQGTASTSKNGDIGFISFRGTASMANWKQDLDMYTLAEQTIQGKKLKLHAGFSKIISENKVQIDNAAKKVMGPSKTILITGHSLGGALANLYAVYLKELVPDIKIHLVTVGSPRVGGADFAKMLEASCVGAYRFVNYEKTDLDMIPRTPNFKVEMKAEKFWFIHGGLQVSLGNDGTVDSKALIQSVALHSVDLYMARIAKLSGTEFCSSKVKL